MMGKRYQYHVIRKCILEVLPLDIADWVRVATLYKKKAGESKRRNPRALKLYWKNHGWIIWLPSHTHVCSVGLSDNRQTFCFKTRDQACAMFVIPNVTDQYRNMNGLWL